MSIFKIIFIFSFTLGNSWVFAAEKGTHDLILNSVTDHKTIVSLTSTLSANILKLDTALQLSIADSAHARAHIIMELLVQFDKFNIAEPSNNNKKRKKGCLKNLENLALAIHIQTEKKNMKRALKFIKKLKSQWQILLKLYAIP